MQCLGGSNSFAFFTRITWNVIRTAAPFLFSSLKLTAANNEAAYCFQASYGGRHPASRQPGKRIGKSLTFPCVRATKWEVTVKNAAMVQRYGDNVGGSTFCIENGPGLRPLHKKCALGSQQSSTLDLKRASIVSGVHFLNGASSR